MKETCPLWQRLELMGCTVSGKGRLKTIKQCCRTYHEFWSKGTQKQCSSHITRWFNYSTRHNIDPFDSSVYQGTEFLAEYFHEGVS